MKRITVISPGGTVVEIDEDDLPRYESFGYKQVKPEKQKPTQEKVNGNI